MRKEIRKKKFTIYCDKAAVMVVDEKELCQGYMVNDWRLYRECHRCKAFVDNFYK